MQYRYHMKQIPQVLEAQKSIDHVASDYLEELTNWYAKKGWEFFRVDTLGVYRPASCLASLFGQSGETIFYYVVTFRQPVVE